MHWDDDANEEFEWEEVDDKREALNMLFDDDAAVSALITSGEEGGEEGRCIGQFGVGSSVKYSQFRGNP